MSEGESRLHLWPLVFCLVGNFLLRVAAASGGTLISLYLASLDLAGGNVSATVVGLASVLFYSAELVGAPAFGVLTDLKGIRTFLLLGPGFGSVAIGLIYLAPSIPLLLLSRMLQGLSTASSVPSALSYLSARSGGSEILRGRVMGLYEVASIVGLAGGFALGGVLWDIFRHEGFLLVVAVYALSALCLWFVSDTKGVVKRAEGYSQYLSLLRSGAVLRLVPAWVAVNAIVGLWFSHLDFQMGKRDDPTQLLVGGFSGTQIGLYTAGFMVVFTIGIALWTLSFGRLSTIRIMVLSLFGLAGLVASTGILNRLNQNQHLAITLSLICVSLSLLVMSGFTPAALAYLSGLAEERADVRGSVMGLYSVFLGVGQLIGSGIGGFFAQWQGVNGMLIFTMILGVIAAYCVLALLRFDQRQSSRTTDQAITET